MTLPVPRPGLVIRYSYLWADDHRRGAEEGLKDRPCAIVVARQAIEGREVVTVVPVTHTPPANQTDGIELPAPLKALLGLDEMRSWIIVTETNEFIWPGVDLRPVHGARPSRYDYGMLPPRFFTFLRDRVLTVLKDRKLRRVPRSE